MGTATVTDAPATVEEFTERIRAAASSSGDSGGTKDPLPFTPPDTEPVNGHELDVLTDDELRKTDLYAILYGQVQRTQNIDAIRDTIINRWTGGETDQFTDIPAHAVRAALTLAELDIEAGRPLFDPSAATEGFTAYDLDSITDYETPKDHIIAGEGLFRILAGTLITGGTGIGKSVFVSGIAVQLAAGRPILNCIHVPKPVRVLYIEAENDPDTLQRDILAAVKHSEADPATVQQNLTIHHAWGLNGDDFVKHLEYHVQAIQPTIVIVDPYQAYVNPGDLNGTHAFLEWMGPIQQLMHEHTFGLALVAHTPKPRDRDDWNAREMVYMAAGTSAISNWARTSMELMTVKHELDRFKLTFGKNAERNGLVSDDDGKVVRELFLQHSGNIHEPYWAVADSQTPPKPSRYADAIMELALDHPSMRYEEIAERLGCSKGTVGRYYPRG